MKTQTDTTIEAPALRLRSRLRAGAVTTTCVVVIENGEVVAAKCVKN